MVYRIEFRDQSDLSQVIDNYSTGSIAPGPLCVASPSTLLFSDTKSTTSEPHDVYEIDCSRGRLKITDTGIKIDFKGIVWDICFVRNEGKPLLLSTQYGRTHAYNTHSGKQEWKNEVGGNCVTTDGRNYVFVCEQIRKTSHILSLSDGKKMGPLIRKEDKDFGELRHMRWCHATSSLKVAHYVENEIYISTIRFIGKDYK